MAAKAKPEHLRAVSKDETPPEPPAPKKPLTLDEAIASGDYLEILRAQRRDIANDLPNEKGPAKAALHRQFALLSKEIAQLEQKARQERAEDGDDEDSGAEDEAWDGTWSSEAAT